MNLTNITTGRGGLIDFADASGNFNRSFGENCSFGSSQIM